MPKIRHLRCACCGGDAPAKKQFFNQDTGFGLCARCAIRITAKEGADYVRRCYGEAGVHHSIEKWIIEVKFEGRWRRLEKTPSLGTAEFPHRLAAMEALRTVFPNLPEYTEETATERIRNIGL